MPPDKGDVAVPASAGLAAMARAGQAFTDLCGDLRGTLIENEPQRRWFAQRLHSHVAALDDDARTALLHMALANLLVDAGLVSAEPGYYTTLLERRTKGR